MAYHTFASTLSPTRFASTLYVVRQLYSVHLEAGVLDEPYSQLTPLSGVAGQTASLLVYICPVSILCSLAVRYGDSAERA
jgi:hypothetical protein